MHVNLYDLPKWLFFLMHVIFLLLKDQYSVQMPVDQTGNYIYEIRTVF